MRLQIEGWDMIKVLMLDHAGGNVVTELFNLFANIAEGSIA